MRLPRWRACPILEPSSLPGDGRGLDRRAGPRHLRQCACTSCLRWSYRTSSPDRATVIAAWSGSQRSGRPPRVKPRQHNCNRVTGQTRVRAAMGLAAGTFRYGTSPYRPLSARRTRAALVRMLGCLRESSAVDARARGSSAGGPTDESRRIPSPPTCRSSKIPRRPGRPTRLPN